MLDYKIETFLSLCETRSYTETAEYLHLTQPAVTRQIQSLEQYYHCDLFYNTGRTVQLTESGIYLREKMQQIRVQEREIQKHLDGLQRKVPLEVGITPSITYSRVMRWLCEQMQIDSDCYLHLQIQNSHTLLQMLRDGKLDAILTEGDLADEQMTETILYREYLLAVASPKLANTLYGSSLRDLLSQTLILSEPGSGLRTLLQRQLRADDISIYDFAQICEVNSLDVMKQALYADSGIAFLLDSTVKQDQIENRLNRIYLDSTMIPVRIALLTMREAQNRPELVRLRERLVELSREEVP